MAHDTKKNAEPQAVLVISFDGFKASVNGPIDNPILCMRMLSCAMQLLADHNTKRPQLAVIEG